MRPFWKLFAFFMGSLLLWFVFSAPQPVTGLTVGMQPGTIAQLSSPSPLPSPTVPTVAPSSRQDVCAVVRSMPDAKNTDQFLGKVRVSREQVLLNLDQLKDLMEQIDKDGYGWQTVIGKPDSIDQAQLRPWLLGALRMACDP